MTIQSTVSTRALQQPTDVPPLPMNREALIEDFKRHLSYTLGRDRYSTNHHYHYNALVLTIRDRLMDRWKGTNQAYARGDCRRAYYLSMEFLMGRALRNAQLNLELDDVARTAIELTAYFYDPIGPGDLLRGDRAAACRSRRPRSCPAPGGTRWASGR